MSLKRRHSYHKTSSNRIKISEELSEADDFDRYISRQMSQASLVERKPSSVVPATSNASHASSVRHVHVISQASVFHRLSMESAPSLPSSSSIAVHQTSDSVSSSHKLPYSQHLALPSSVSKPKPLTYAKRSVRYRHKAHTKPRSHIKPRSKYSLVTGVSTDVAVVVGALTTVSVLYSLIRGSGTSLADQRFAVVMLVIAVPIIAICLIIDIFCDEKSDRIKISRLARRNRIKSGKEG